MGDPVTIGLLVASTALSAYSSISAGQAASAAADAEAQQAREQAELARLEALDAEVQRRRSLEQTLSTQRARASAAGLDTESGSVLAISEESKQLADEDLRSIRIQGAASARRFELGAYGSSIESKQASRSGFLKAGQSILSGGQDYLRYRETKSDA